MKPKKLHGTMRQTLQHTSSEPELTFFLSTLEHFFSCARLEHADRLQASCEAMQDEIKRLLLKQEVANDKHWLYKPVQGLQRSA